MGVAVETRQEGGVPVVGVVGDFDTYTVPQVREQLLSVLRDHPEGRVIVDLSRTDYLDAGGLGVLIGCCRRAQERGGELRLVIPEERVRRIFEITGLTQVFRIFKTVSVAAA